MVSCPPAMIALLAAVLALHGCKGQAGEPASRAGAPDDWASRMESWEYPDPIPEVWLVDHDGRAFSLGELAGGHVLLGFIFTRCPQAEACPLTVEKMRRVQERWRGLVSRGQDRGEALRLLGITLDPAFDTPERLKAFAAQRDLDLSSWILATGPEELVTSALPSLFNVLALPRGPGDIQHTVKIALLSPGLRIAAEWSDNELDTDDVIAAILGTAGVAPAE